MEVQLKGIELKLFFLLLTSQLVRPHAALFSSQRQGNRGRSTEKKAEMTRSKVVHSFRPHKAPCQGHYSWRNLPRQTPAPPSLFIIIIINLCSIIFYQFSLVCCYLQIILFFNSSMIHKVQQLPKVTVEMTALMVPGSCYNYKV